MQSKKLRNRTELAVFIIGVLAVIVLLNYAANKWFSRVDLTHGKEYSVSKSTKNVLKGLDDIINIKVYFSKNLPPNVHQTVTDVKDLLSEYKAYAGKNLKITWEDPAASEDAKRQARAMGIPEVQMQTFEQDKAQVINAFLGIAILYADKKEAIPVVQNLQNLEYDLTLAIMKVSRTTIPKVGILKTDTMPYIPPNIRSQMNMKDQTEEKYASVYEGLRQNYDVQTIDISEGQQIDTTIKTLLIPGGSKFSNRKLFEIDQFFMEGGNLIVLADPVKVSFEYGVNGTIQESKMFDLLEHYGVRVDKDLVLDPSCGQVTIPQKFGPFSMNVAVPYPYFVRVGADGFNKQNPAVAPLSEIILPWTSSLSLLVDTDSKKSGQNGVVGTILANSSKKSWTATGYFNLNPQQQWAPPQTNDVKSRSLIAHLTGNFSSYFTGKTVPPVKDEAGVPGDSLNKINLSTSNPADANRQIIPVNKNGHLVVVGNAEFCSNQNATPGNMALLMNLVDWLSLDQNLISIRTRAIKDRTIDSDLLKNGSAKPNIIRTINILLMPVLVILIGFVIFFRRREVIPVVATQAALSSDKKEDKSK